MAYRRPLSLVTVLLSSSLALACGGDDEDPNTAADFQAGQQGQQPYGGQDPYAPQPQPSATEAAPQGQVSPLGAILSDPNTLQSIVAGALAGTQAALGAMAGGELAPIEQGIKAEAQTQAKGARPEGQLMSAKLQQDGHAEAVFTMAPGKCYSVVGFGGLGVFQYQINLISAPPLPPQVLAQSKATGNAPVVGANEQCIRNPTPVPMQVKVDMHMIKGQGLVGAQAYAK